LLSTTIGYAKLRFLFPKFQKNVKAIISQPYQDDAFLNIPQVLHCQVYQREAEEYLDF